jgi:hypothetical protein
MNNTQERISWQLFVSWAGKVTAVVRFWCEMLGALGPECKREKENSPGEKVYMGMKYTESSTAEALNWTCKQVFSLFMRFANLGGERVSK